MSAEPTSRGHGLVWPWSSATRSEASASSRRRRSRRRRWIPDSPWSRRGAPPCRPERRRCAPLSWIWRGPKSAPLSTAAPAAPRSPKATWSRPAPRERPSSPPSFRSTRSTSTSRVTNRRTSATPIWTRAASALSSRRAANPVQIGLSDEEGFPHRGRMDFVDNQLDRDTGTIRARAVVANQGSAVHAGDVRPGSPDRQRGAAGDGHPRGRDQHRSGPQVRVRAQPRQRPWPTVAVTLGRQVEGSGASSRRGSSLASRWW